MDGWREELAKGALLLTVNGRLSRHLRSEWDREMVRAGVGAWRTPAILPLSAWLEERFGESRLEEPPLLLSAFQELLLWEEVVTASEPSLLFPGQAAREAARAWGLLHEWEAPFAGAAWEETGESRAFAGWIRAFRRQCQARRLLSRAELPGFLLERADFSSLPATLLLAGFDQIPPLMQRLFAQARAAGVVVEILPTMDTHGPPDCSQVLLADRQAENRAVARWARTWLEQRPGERLGVVVGDLAGRREELITAFGQIFRPGAPFRFTEGELDGLVNVSLGEPLARRPVVAAALSLLGLGGGEEAGWEEVSRLLASPFWGGEVAEEEGRFALDARLREQGWRTIGVGEWLRQARRAELPGLARSLAGFLEEEKGGRARPGVWAERFSRLLTRLGWPGKRGLSSREYQAVAAFRDLLGDYAGLDSVRGGMTYEAALTLLSRLAEETLFQPETPAAQVEILGVLEAAGSRFQGLWILGWSEETWPQAPSPSPLIPFSLQKTLDMPHATARKELDFALAVTERLLQSAETVIVSHAVLDEDREVRPSPLLAALPLGDGEPWLDPPQEHALRRETTALLPRATEPVPPWPLEREARGGAALLKAQSHCPFQAFARFRLDVEPLNEPSPGPDARERGILLHDVLAGVWRRLGHSHALLSLTDGARAELLGEEIARALHAQNWSRRFSRGVVLTLEESRLRQVVEEWLLLERERPPFRVEACEMRVALTLEGVRLALRLDRVDRLRESDEAILLDYKSGEVAARDWFGERPRDPQLPLYACAWHEASLAAVAFACVRAHRAAFAGVSREEGLLPGVRGWSEPLKQAEVQPRSWEEALGEWQRVVGGLARGFALGEAAVDPENAFQTCRLCPYPALCRIGEGKESDHEP